MQKRLAASIATVAAVLVIPGVASAMDGTMTFEGTKTKGASERFVNATYTLAGSTDPATMARRTRATHSQVCVQRPPSVSSPLLFGAVWTNEIFKSVQIDFANGLRLKLSDASAVSFKVATDKDQEEVCFVFKAIEVSFKGQNAVTANPATGV